MSRKSAERDAEGLKSRRLLLVRHSNPVVRPDVPARDWSISDEGVVRARQLALRLELERAGSIYSSLEPKALDTATAMADVWQLPVKPVAGIHEHDRSHEPLLARSQFERRLRDFFERPTVVVFGRESADEARRRFTVAITRLLIGDRGDVVLVTHGTVLALYVAAVTAQDAFALWKRLDMPCAVTLTVPELKLAGITYVGEQATVSQAGMLS